MIVELNFSTGWKAIAPSVEIPHCCISKAVRVEKVRWGIKINRIYIKGTITGEFSFSYKCSMIAQEGY